MTIAVMFADVVPILATVIRVAPEHHRFVAFRLGRFVDVYGPGIAFLIPFVDRAVMVDLR